MHAIVFICLVYLAVVLFGLDYSWIKVRFKKKVWIPKFKQGDEVVCASREITAHIKKDTFEGRIIKVLANGYYDIECKDLKAYNDIPMVMGVHEDHITLAEKRMCGMECNNYSTACPKCVEGYLQWSTKSAINLNEDFKGSLIQLHADRLAKQIGKDLDKQLTK